MNVSSSGGARATSRGAGGNAAADAVAERLLAIVRAVDGDTVGTNGEALWFEPAGGGPQLRLSAPGGRRCFDRSANFAISHGGVVGGGSDAPPIAALVERIKAVDATPIAGAAPAFRAAAEIVAARCADEATAAPAAPVQWERPRTRDLNVVFLDLCAHLFGRPGDPLAPLHWGFWPDGQGIDTVPAGYDPQRAFSDALLAHVPDGAGSVLDVGCGLGFNARLLAERGLRVTAVSPVPHHCERIERAGLPGVDVRCARFQDLAPDRRYDLLLFSESLNHFPLDDAFLRHCASFLADPGYVLMTDDHPAARVRRIETQSVFRILRVVDITANVAPTTQLWERQLPVVTAYHAALLAILEQYDGRLAAGVRDALARVDNPELRALLSGELTPPAPKGRYVTYLLAPA